MWAREGISNKLRRKPRIEPSMYKTEDAKVIEGEPEMNKKAELEPAFSFVSDSGSFN